VTKAKPLQPWGEALEQIREQRLKASKGAGPSETRHGSKRALELAGGMAARQYREMLEESIKGPTLLVLGRILVALNCSWEEFGRTLDGVLIKRRRG